jgi:hypothetical protein
MIWDNELAKFSHRPLFLIFDPDRINRNGMFLLEFFILIWEVVAVGVSEGLSVFGDWIQNDMHKLYIERGGQKGGKGVIQLLLWVLDILLTHSLSEETPVPLDD